MKANLGNLGNAQFEESLTKLSVFVTSDIAAYVKNTPDPNLESDPIYFAIRYLLLESLLEVFSNREGKLQEIQSKSLQKNPGDTAMGFAVQELMTDYRKINPDTKPQIFLKKNILDFATKDLKQLDNRIAFLLKLERGFASIVEECPEKICEQAIEMVINQYDNPSISFLLINPFIEVLKKIQEEIKNTKNNLGEDKAVNLMQKYKRLSTRTNRGLLDLLVASLTYREKLLFHLSYANDANYLYKDKVTLQLAERFYLSTQQVSDYWQKIEAGKNEDFKRIAREFNCLEPESKIYIRYLSFEQLIGFINEYPSVIEDPFFFLEISKKFPDHLPDKLIAAIIEITLKKPSQAFNLGKLLLDKRYVEAAMEIFSFVEETDPHYKNTQYELNNFKFFKGSSSISLAELTGGAVGIKEGLVNESTSKLQEKIFSQLEDIKTEADYLRNKDQPKAAESALNLYNTILEAHNQFVSQKISKQAFKDICFQAMDETKAALKKHHRWQQILGNLSLAIIGVGVFYGAAGIANKAIRGNFLFFQTDSANKLKKLEGSLVQYLKL